MEDDDELQRAHDAYKKGEMLTGELKALCIKHLQEYVKEFQDIRSNVTEKTVDDFWAVRPLNDCTGNPRAPVTLPIRAQAPTGDVTSAAGDGQGDGKISKSQLKKIEKEKQIAAKKAAKAAEKEATKP